MPAKPAVPQLVMKTRRYLLAKYYHLEARCNIGQHSYCHLFLYIEKKTTHRFSRHQCSFVRINYIKPDISDRLAVKLSKQFHSDKLYFYIV